MERVPSLIDSLMSIRRPRRPAAVGRCSVCRLSVAEGEEIRLRRGVLAHRHCATYKVRHFAGRA